MAGTVPDDQRPITPFRDSTVRSGEEGAIYEGQAEADENGVFTFEKGRMV